MEFRELQHKTTLALSAYGKENDIRVDDEYILIKLFEEMGSIAKTVLVYKNKCERKKIIAREDAKKKMMAEVVDTIGLLMAFSSQLNIDVEAGLEEKWLSKYPESQK